MLKGDVFWMSNLNEEKICELRNELMKVLISHHGEDKIKFDMPVKYLEQLIFDTDKRGVKSFVTSFNYIKKIDLTDVCFDDVSVSHKDFTGSKGVRINPQKVKDKNFWETILTDVEIIGSFDGATLYKTNFKGSKGAKVDVQKLGTKRIVGVNFADAMVIGTFEGVELEYVDFTGSIGTKMEYCYSKQFTNCNFTDVEFYDDDVYMAIKNAITKELKKI